MLILDLDGTISDPSLGICRCVNYALRSHTFPEVAEDAIIAEIGPPLDETFGKLQPRVDKENITSFISKYRERYAEVGYSENKIYPGITESLRLLSERGVKMGVCTSKREDFAKKILAMFGLLSLFDFVDGGDVGIKKHEQLTGLLQAGKIDQSAVMVGDRAVDIYAAKVNGLRSMGVLWGFGNRSELEEAGADVILSRTVELGKLDCKRMEALCKR